MDVSTPRIHDEQDRTRKCSDCGSRYVLTAQAQRFFEMRGLPWPRRCPACRAARRRQARPTDDDPRAA